jgi:hypothetical protein
MPLLGLSPEDIAARVHASSAPPHVPSLGGSLARGVIGFTIVSIAGFSPWVFGERWFHQQFGEAGLYAICALVFIGLSGLLLHGLIIGPGSLWRFYVLFGIAFALYSVGWIVGWMLLRGHVGGIVGLLAGTVLMGVILCAAFGAWRALPIVIGALFLFNAAGYFGGGVFAEALASFNDGAHAKAAMLSWGAWYGIGFGAGIGLAFYLCQAGARDLLDAPAA